MADTPAQTPSDDVPFSQLANAAYLTARGGSTTRGSQTESGRNQVTSRGQGRGRSRVIGKVTAGRASGNTRGGSGRTRNTGVRRKQFNYEDPSHNWTLQSPRRMELMVEDDFANSILSERARMFCKSALERLRIQETVRELPSGRAGMIVLFIEPALRQCMEWMNQSIRLHKKFERTFELPDMYRFLSVFLFSHCTGFSFEKTIQILNMIGHSGLRLKDVRFISSNILGFSPVGRGNCGMETWNALRDKTQQLADFERISFGVVRKVFFETAHIFATLDDDLFGTRATNNQVKTCSNRKADREGHTVDVIVDALFRVVIGLRFRRRGEKVETAVEKVMEMITEGRGEEAFNTFTVTADRGYGNESLANKLSEIGSNSMVVLPDHLLRCHPFAGRSYFTVGREDEVVAFQEQQENGDSVCSDVDQHPTSNQDQAIVVDQSAQAQPQVVQEDNNVKEGFDRKRAFIIDDDPNAAPEVFHAIKKRRGGNDIHAIAVREHGTEKFARLLRFFIVLPDPLVKLINKWIAVPRPNQYTKHLFGTRGRSGGQDLGEDGDEVEVNNIDLCVSPVHGTAVPEVVDVRKIIEPFLTSRCNVLTVGQRCADWFIMRQFRVTGTIAGKILLSSNNFRSRAGIEGIGPERTMTKWASIFVQSWFSSARSTKAMKRGSVNKDAVMSAISQKEFIIDVFECGMFEMIDDHYLACSPDGIAVLDLTWLEERAYGMDDALGRVDVNGKQCCVASVEIKSVIAESTVNSAVQSSTADLIVCRFGDEIFRKYIPTKHAGQVMQQMIVLNLNSSLYIRATECSMLYVVLVQADALLLTDLAVDLRSVARPVVSWAHLNQIAPEFYSPADKAKAMNRLSFWRMVNSKVKTDGPLPPVKLFQHGTQSLYSKTRGGVDGSTQARSTLGSMTSHMMWEQKLVTQTFQTVVVNAFIAWRIKEQRGLLTSSLVFQSLETFRHALNTVQSFADFTFDASQELLDYASTLQRQIERDGQSGQNDDDDLMLPQKIKELSERAKACKRFRLSFFNTPEMVDFRLKSLGHLPKQTSSKSYCALCGTSADGRRGHKSCFCCPLCDVYLCVRVWHPWRTSCWNIWHRSRELRPRTLPPKPVADINPSGADGAPSTDPPEVDSDHRDSSGNDFDDSGVADDDQGEDHSLEEPGSSD